MLRFFTSLISGGVKSRVMYFWSIRHFDNIFGSFLCQASEKKTKKEKIHVDNDFFWTIMSLKNLKNILFLMWKLTVRFIFKYIEKMFNQTPNLFPFSFNRLCQELYNWKRSRLQRDNICHQKWYSVSGLELNDSPWAQVRVQQQRQWE